MIDRTSYRIIAAAIVMLVALSALTGTTPVFAGGTVTDCSNDADFSSKVTGGGAVIFSCGTATISFDTTKTIAAVTTIDGGNTITLSGAFGRRLFAVNNAVTLTLKNITLMNGYNSSSAGGGAVSNNGHLILDHVTIQNMPDSAFNGGAIFTSGALDITNSTISNSKAAQGGAIYASGTGAVVTIAGSDFHDNHATALNGDGGAIQLVGGAILQISATQIYTNTAVSVGGGLNIDHSTANLTGVTLSENHADDGGAISAFESTTKLVQVTLAGNIADQVGGGIVSTSNDITLVNTTVSGNSAQFGGGIYTEFGPATLTNVTLSENSAPGGGGGITNFSGADTKLYLKNVLIANSKAGGNCDFRQAPDTSNHNLSSDDTCNFGTGRDSRKLKLGPLETNGGSTLTHRLKPDSPAIDAGVFVNTILNDQRSVTRPRGAAFDVGAFEFVPCPSAPTKPLLLGPISNALVTTTQTVLLDWAGPDCAKTFGVAVRQDSKQGAIVFSKNKIKTTQVTTGTLAKNHKYFWLVTACKGTLCTTSSWGKFRVQ